MGELVGVLVVDVQQRAGEVLGTIADLGGDELAQVAAIGRHVAGVLDLLGWRRAPPGQGQPVGRPSVAAVPSAPAEHP